MADSPLTHKITPPGTTQPQVLGMFQTATEPQKLPALDPNLTVNHPALQTTPQGTFLFDFKPTATPDTGIPIQPVSQPLQQTPGQHQPPMAISQTTTTGGAVGSTAPLLMFNPNAPKPATTTPNPLNYNLFNTAAKQTTTTTATAQQTTLSFLNGSPFGKSIGLSLDTKSTAQQPAAPANLPSTNPLAAPQIFPGAQPVAPSPATNPLATTPLAAVPALQPQTPLSAPQQQPTAQKQPTPVINPLAPNPFNAAPAQPFGQPISAQQLFPVLQPAGPSAAPPAQPVQHPLTPAQMPFPPTPAHYQLTAPFVEKAFPPHLDFEHFDQPLAQMKIPREQFSAFLASYTTAQFFSDVQAYCRDPSHSPAHPDPRLAALADAFGLDAAHRALFDAMLRAPDLFDMLYRLVFLVQ